MFYKNNEKGKGTTQYDSHFWDKLVRILFISGVVIILLTVAIKWLGFLD
ncbi:MAG: hypothetical protein QNK20_05000 [Aureibaculum sp.]|nr:hypothetical protein [Aureibaculum sp.]